MPTMLVIDDDRLNCDMLQVIFARHGFQVVTAQSGREGLGRFQTLQPDVTLLDLRMPEVDGLAVLKEIRARDPLAPVVMLGAGATDIHENLARELGVTDFLRKGLSLDVLIRTVNRVARPAAQAQESRYFSTAPSTEGAKSERILVIDDEPLVRELLVQFLEMRGYAVQGAASGEECLALVERDPPDVILLDIIMPGLDGVEVIKALQPRGFAGGIIVLTGSQSEELLRTAWDLGIQEVLYKPVDLDRLLMAVQLVLVCREG